MIPKISLCDIFGITTKTPYEAALMGERHVRIEISDFVMCTFVLLRAPLNSGKSLRYSGFRRFTAAVVFFREIC